LNFVTSNQLKMKMSHEYWYKYSEIDVSRSPLRKDVLRPTGAFIFNGKIVSRTNPQISSSDNIPLSHDILPFVGSLLHDQGSKSMELSKNASNNPYTRTSSSIVSFNDQALSSASKTTRAYSPDKYYNRLSTPALELDEDHKVAERTVKVDRWKHLFHEDNFVHKSVAPGKCERLWLPSHRKMKTLERILSEETHVEQDPPYKEVMEGTYQWKPNKPTTTMTRNR